MRILIACLLIILIIISGGLVIRYAQNAIEMQQKLNNERFKRIKTEESLSIANKKILTLKGEVKKANAEIQKLNKILKQVQSDNSNLNVKLNKANNTIKQLETKIKELVEISAAAKENNTVEEKTMAVPAAQ